MVNLLKHGLLIAFVFGLFVGSYAQNDSDTLIPYRNGKKWGYMNTHGELVIKTKYQEAYPFGGNRGRVKKKGKYGFVNPEGEVKIPLVYDSISDFNNGAAILKGTLFYIDTLGIKKHLVLGCGGVVFNKGDYRVYQIGNLKGVIKTYPYDTLISQKYLEIQVFEFMDIFAVKNNTGKYGIVSVTDSVIQPFIYDTIFVRDYWNNHWLETQVSGNSGAVDNVGQVIMEAKYSNIKRSKYCFFVGLKNGQTGFVYNRKEYWKH